LNPARSNPALIIAAAKENDFDVVLIDTAGRMQDNEVNSLHLLNRHH